MGITKFAKDPPNGVAITSEEELTLTDECQKMLALLPKEKGWRTSYLYQYQGFWCQAAEIQAISTFQKHFQARHDDIVLATIPKSGTTWLKALTFALVNRDIFPVDLESPKTKRRNPLLYSNPHDLVPFFEYKLYANNKIPDFSRDDIDLISSNKPRLFGTHIPYPSLADSIKESDCRVVYLCRNPLDTFVSSWHFIGSMTRYSLEEAFEMCSDGVIGFGPFWDHMLGYWKESLEMPEKVLFLTYEDLKEDTSFQLKRLANFLGCPFSLEEERDGVVEKVVKLCSFENLKDLEVNKKGKSIKNFENKKLFRKGEVGDWVNHLSPEMVDKMSRVMEQKLGSSGLKFKNNVL